ncbi:MAG: glycosyltransferase family 2 protein [Ruminococcus sp.]|nr:glycosyltransferase family 2 protein [Ruminococcus sp.]
MTGYRKVDIIIPTCEADERTVQAVKRLLKQSYPIGHIYIINTDKGAFPVELEHLSDKIQITHILPEQFDHGGTRHQGAMQSHAEILIYLTQDALPVNETLVEKLVEPFADERVGAVYARQLPTGDCRLIERYTRTFNYPPEGRVKSEEDLPELGIKTYFCSNVCAAYRKSIYESLGGFEQKVIFNEDMIMAGRIIQSGYKVVYAAEAQVIHSHNDSCIRQMKRNFDLAVSQVEHPEIFEEIKSEKEGIRLVRQTARYLLQQKKPWLLFSLFAKSGFKYLGYWLGKHYRKLPRWLVLRCTMNRGYWM